MRMRALTAALGVSCLTALVGCGQLMDAAAADGERLDNDLHARMTRMDWDGIYNAADPAFRNAVTAEQWRAYLSGVVEKLGTPGPCMLTDWGLNTRPSGTFLSTACDTSFSSNANGTELIAWRVSNGQYRLLAYQISSEYLVTR